MDNQASEVKRNSLNKSDEDVKLDEILDALWQYTAYDRLDIGIRPEEAKQAIKSIIRTEKLKLLAEVRERVVGENQHSEHKEWDCPCGATHSFTEEWHATNRLRDEQRTALAKLEADL